MRRHNEKEDSRRWECVYSFDGSSVGVGVGVRKIRGPKYKIKELEERQG